MDTASVVQQVLAWLQNVGTFVATNAWRIAMRQVYFYGFMDLLLGTIFLVAGFIFWHKSSKKVKEDGWDNRRYDFISPQSALAVVAVGCIIAGLISMLCSIRFFWNPEWYAISLIIQQVTNK